MRDMTMGKINLGWKGSVDGFAAVLEAVRFKENNPTAEIVTDVVVENGRYVEVTRRLEIEHVDGRGNTILKVYLLTNDPGVYRLRDVVCGAGPCQDLLVTLRDGQAKLVDDEQTFLKHLCEYLRRRARRVAA